jgi:hypothetical protein
MCWPNVVVPNLWLVNSERFKVNTQETITCVVLPYWFLKCYYYFLFQEKCIVTLPYMEGKFSFAITIQV